MSAPRDVSRSCYQLAAQIWDHVSTRNTHCGAPSSRDRSFSYWTDKTFYKEHDRSSTISSRTTLTGRMSALRDVSRCTPPTVKIEFGPQYDYVLFILQYRSKRPISFRHSIVFSPHHDYVLLVLRYRSKRPISSNHSSLYLAHNTLTFYSPYSIDRSARFLPLIVYCIWPTIRLRFTRPTV